MFSKISKKKGKGKSTKYRPSTPAPHIKTAMSKTKNGAKWKFTGGSPHRCHQSDVEIHFRQNLIFNTKHIDKAPKIKQVIDKKYGDYYDGWEMTMEKDTMVSKRYYYYGLTRLQAEAIINLVKGKIEFEYSYVQLNSDEDGGNFNFD